MTAALLLGLLAGSPSPAPGVLDRGGLELQLPVGWRETAPPRSAGPAVTVRLGPEEGARFQFLLTVVRARPGARLDTRALAEEQGRKLLPTAAPGRRPRRPRRPRARRTRPTPRYGDEGLTAAAGPRQALRTTAGP